MQATPLGALGKFVRFVGGEVMVPNHAFGLFNFLREGGTHYRRAFHFVSEAGK